MRPRLGGETPPGTLHRAETFPGVRRERVTQAMSVGVEEAVSARPGRGDRFALRVMQVGAVAVVLIASTRKLYELDRFFVPKEIVLHLAAVIAVLCALRSIGRLNFTRTDVFLCSIVLIGAASSALAQNPWLAIRALAITASSLLLFWIGRGLREAGLGRSLMAAIALAVVIASITSLLQAYGVRTELFSLNRSPGGTLGNRNFIGHVGSFGLPVVLFGALAGRTARGRIAALTGVAIVSAALVLTRSRAAWLATALVLLLFAAAMILAPALRRSRKTWLRLTLAILFIGGGIAAALMIPNTLRWRSDDPYLESVRGVAEYDEGSGRGRLIQYEHSLRMALRNPVLGVGPGNWAVQYPDHAAEGDPSLDRSAGGMTANPWPSSDWIAMISERGAAAFLLMALVIVSLALAAFRRMRGASNPDEALEATALLGTVGAAALAGLFDAVLLLAVPAFLVWSTIGALWQGGAPLSRFPIRVAVLLVALLAAVGAFRSGAQIAAIEIDATRSDRESLELAARIDPGNYRVQLDLARKGGEGKCEHALAAKALFPNAAAARRVARGCD